MTDIPIDFKQLEKLAHGQETKPTKKKSSTGKKSRGKRKPSIADKDTTVSEPNELIYKVMHYYTRPTDTFSAVLREVRQEAELHNLNVRFCAHDHSYGTTCRNCQLIIGGS